MSLLDWVWDLFRAPKKVSFTNTEKLTGVQVGQLLNERTYSKNIYIGDEEYTLINNTDIEEFLRQNPVSGRKYLIDAHDCDDFSFELMGDVSDVYSKGAFGIIWGNRARDGVPHAWNFYINQDKQLKYVEPQNDEIFEPSVENIWIIII